MKLKEKKIAQDYLNGGLQMIEINNIQINVKCTFTECKKEMSMY